MLSEVAFVPGLMVDLHEEMGRRVVGRGEGTVTYGLLWQSSTCTVSNLCCDTFGGGLGGLQKLDHAWLKNKLRTKTGSKVLSVGVLHSLAVV